MSDFRTWGRSDAAPGQLAWISSELCGAEEGRGESDHCNSFWGLWSSTRAQILEERITEPDSASTAEQARGRHSVGSVSWC